MNIGNASNTSQNRWALNPTGAAADAVFSNISYGGGGQALAVVRIDYGSGAGNDSAYLFLNPTLGVEPQIADASVTITGRNFTFSDVRFFAGDASGTFNGLPRPHAVITGDEIRIGDTYTDVTPFVAVPEPALLGVGAFGALALSRRQRRV